jgi:exodeoxyribonuclease VII large subunit
VNQGPGREARNILGVRQLSEAIQTAVQAAFPEPVWVRGEVQRLPAGAAGRKHVYFELHEGDDRGSASYQLPAAIMGWDRDRYGLGRYLDGSDPAFRLQDKLEVCLLCRVDFYPPFGKLSLKVQGIDPEFSLGKLEAQRRRVYAWLEREGLLQLNKQLAVPSLPLRVGLITSAGSAAERDFRTGLDRLPGRFQVELADCRMQGEQTAPQVTAALARLAARDLDVIVITRGGGSRADLSWFDQQDLCAAVARCPRPVVTAIGHEIDTSLADLCAHTQCKTPTAAAELLVDRVQEQIQRVQEARDRLARAALARLEAADRRLHTAAAGLESRTGRLVARHQQRLQAAALRMAAGTRQRTVAASRQTDDLAGRLARAAGRSGRDAWRRLDRLAAALAPPARRRPGAPARARLHAHPRRRRPPAAPGGGRAAGPAAAHALRRRRDHQHRTRRGGPPPPPAQGRLR